MACETHKAANGDVLANLADQRLSTLLDAGAVKLEPGERIDVGRRLLGYQCSQRTGEGLEVVVFGDKVGLAVELDHGGSAAVGRMVNTDDALGGDTRCRLVRLVAKLDPKNFLSAGHIASRFGECFLALHHRCIGLLAQFLDHRRGDFSHLDAPSFKPLRLRFRQTLRRRHP